MSSSAKSLHTIRLGISTCPNDTFAFHALMHRLVDTRGLDFQVELLDIQQLNTRLLAGEFDVAKASFAAALELAEQTWVLPSGSALGFGVGPLLLAARKGSTPRDITQVTICPGQHTTATLLFQLFYGNTTRIEHDVFSRIMPRLQSAKADFGVCIHEGRFTWQDQGLYLVEDLGTRWERETNHPLPLGGILASRALDAATIQKVQDTIQDSIRWAREQPEETLPTMRHYAQEFNDAVLMQHVDLYVNEWTVELGAVGAGALAALSSRAAELGDSQRAQQSLEIWNTPSRG